MDRKSKIRGRFFDLGTLGISQVLAKLLSAAKDIFVAYYLGASAAVDLYFLVISIAGYASNLVNGPIASIALPLMAKSKSGEGPVVSGAAKHFFSRSSGLALLLILVTPVFLFFRFGGESLPVSYILGTLVLLMLTVPMNTVTQIGYSFLSHRLEFRQISWIGLLNPIFGLVVFVSTVAFVGEWALLLGYFAANFVDCVVYAKHFPVPWPHVFARAKESFTATRGYNDLMLAGALLGSTTIVDNWMVASCGQGAIAEYNYGVKGVFVVNALLAGVFISYLHPYLNRLLSEDRAQFKKLYGQMVGAILLLGMLLCALLFFLAEPFIEFVFNRGEMKSYSLVNSIEVMRAFAFQLPFFALGGLASRCLSSIQQNRAILKVACGSLILNVVLNTVLRSTMGPAGIASSTSIVYFFSFVALNFCLVKSLFFTSAKAESASTRPPVHIFISSLSSGGAERQCVLLANGLAERGYHVTIQVLGGSASFYPVPESVEVVYLQLISETKTFLDRFASLFRRLRGIRHVLNQSQPHAMILSFMDITNVLCIVASLGTGKRVVAFERSDPHFQPTSRGVRLIRNCAYLFASKIVVQSLGAKKYFQRRRVYTLPNVSIAPTPSTALEKKPKGFVCISRLSHEKGLEALIRHFSDLLREVGSEATHLDIYGAGPLKSHLQVLINNLGVQSCVQLKGLDPLISQKLRQYRGLLLHSRYEGFPNAIVEALHAGIPVLATETAGADEIARLTKHPLLKICHRAGYGEALKAFYAWVVDEADGVKVPPDALAVFSEEKVLSVLGGILRDE